MTKSSTAVVVPSHAAATTSEFHHWGLMARLVAALLRRALYIFFRQIEIVGLDKLPSGRPLVLVANHVNGIVDPLLVGLLRLRARFLAKSTLWGNPIIRPLLQVTGAIPVYRHQDAGADTDRNTQSFERCHAALAAGEVIALFPEGRSHNAASLAPLKTGAARIVLAAGAKHPGIGIRIVPVGLSFDAKTLFRSRAVVRIGEAIDPAAEQRLYGVEAWPAVRRLTQRISAGLAAVTVNCASWDEARLIERAADLYAQPTSEQEAPLGLAERFAMRQAFADGYQRALARDPEQVRAVAQKVARYDGLLRLLQLRDEQVVAPAALPRVGRGLWRSAPRLLGALPFALVGTVINWMPYRLVGALANRCASEADVVATYKLLGGVLLFPLWWLLCAALLGGLAGPVAAVCAAPAAAVCGYVALRFHERRAELWADARAGGLLWSRANVAGEIARRRAELVGDLRRLAADRTLSREGEG